MRSIMAAALALAATAAHAQTGQGCLAPAEMRQRLASAYGEVPVALADSGAGIVMMFATPDGSTWTLVVRVEKALCIIASGTNWQEIEAPPVSRPQDRGA